MPHAVLEAKEVYKIYDMGQTEVRALDGVSLSMNKGDFVSIMGPSGSGKTTLLDVMSALLRPSKGEVFIRGKPVSSMDDNELALARGKTIGFIFQTFNLIPRMTALENVMLPLWFQNVPPKERQERATAILERVGLGERAKHRPPELSGGQRQRVAIARALAVDPDVIVADEPTGNLDSVSGEQILKLIDDLNKKEGKTVLMVTHERSVGKIAHKIVHLKDGKIIKNEINGRKKK